jgi:hypothetical protein
MAGTTVTLMSMSTPTDANAPIAKIDWGLDVDRKLDEDSDMNQRRHRPGSGARHHGRSPYGWKTLRASAKGDQADLRPGPTASVIGPATASAVGSAASYLTPSSPMTCRLRVT